MFAGCFLYKLRYVFTAAAAAYAVVYIFLKKQLTAVGFLSLSLIWNFIKEKEQ